MSDVESTTNNETSTATPINPENSYPITQVQSKKSVTEIYQKKTQLEHILLRPDTYIGSVEFISSPMWVFNKNTKNFEYRTITIVPGLYKIFDEILVSKYICPFIYLKLIILPTIIITLYYLNVYFVGIMNKIILYYYHYYNYII